MVAQRTSQRLRLREGRPRKAPRVRQSRPAGDGRLPGSHLRHEGPRRTRPRHRRPAQPGRARQHRLGREGTANLPRLLPPTNTVHHGRSASCKNRSNNRHRGRPTVTARQRRREPSTSGDATPRRDRRTTGVLCFYGNRCSWSPRGKAARDGYISGGTRHNLAWVEPFTDFGAATETERLLLADAQTSGGLLLAGEIPGATVVGELRPDPARRSSSGDRRRHEGQATPSDTCTVVVSFPAQISSGTHAASSRENPPG